MADGHVVGAGRDAGEGEGVHPIGVDDVSITLQKTRAAGDHHGRVHMSAQLHQHPVHDGVAAGNSQHSRCQGLIARVLELSSTIGMG